MQIFCKLKYSSRAVLLGMMVFFGAIGSAYSADGEVVVSTLDGLIEALRDDNISLVKVSKTIELTDGTYLSAYSTASGDRKIVQTISPFLPESGQVSIADDTLLSPQIVAGENDYKLFEVKAGSSVVISNLTLIGGFTGPIIADYNGSAGGIDNFGRLQLYDTDITRTGTALVNRPGATAVLKNCNIVRNANWFGGGVLNLSTEVSDGQYENGGTVIMDCCSLTENQSLGSSHGGGAAENQGLMCLNNSVIANNSSTEIGGGINNCKDGTLYVMNCTMTGNVTTSKEYGTTAGGAIGNAGGAGYVYVVNTILGHNGYDTGEHVNPVCIGRYEGSTDAHACSIVNTVIGATAGMDRIDSVNSSSKVDGLFAGYTDGGIVAAGGDHEGYTSDFSHPDVISNGRALFALYPAMAQQEPSHFLFSMSVSTYFDYSMLIDGTGTVPGMAFETNGVRTVLGPDVIDTAVLVDKTFNGDSRSEYNAIGAVTVEPILNPDTPPPPGIFTVRLGKFTGGKVSGVTIYGDSYISNSVITVHAEAASAYYLDGWMLNDRKVENSAQKYVFSFHIETDTVITPIFVPVETRIFQARQRYPWNNLVDIDYSVAEKDAVRYRLVFLATFEEDGTNRTVQLKSFVKNSDPRQAQKLGEKEDLRKAGEHRVTWDSAADGVAIRNKTIKLKVMACEGDER